MHKYPVGVLGASGYAGRELCALVARHPALTLAFAAANERQGECVRVGGRAVTFVGTDDAPFGDAALVFSALPHGASAPYVARAQETGAKVVDLSADHRATAPYGLPELGPPTRWAVSNANLVANPGCYATAVLLGLAPLVANAVVMPGATVTADAASGVTGAGNSPKREMLFAEVTEDYRPYAVGNTHRHLDEMRATLGSLGADLDLVFTPHLLPVARGILATITVPVIDPLADALALFASYYAGEPFVDVVSSAPSLRDVTHRNVAAISVTAAEGVRRPVVIVNVAIDNLLKGAAGQAMQNANLLLGIEETAGLPR
ncbi:MAG TPA: N-acetyl-gamma-glutamyl-phosphate reductase [Gemmatimonadaceae bacterium]|nr:N-acetyl-gamma-glutamyl-phosphate reductase [Gemmatimonadaceae bacterium]